MKHRASVGPVPGLLQVYTKHAILARLLFNQQTNRDIIL